MLRVTIAAVGKLKDGAERDLVARYVRRFDDGGRGLGFGPLRMIELPESRAASASARKADEAARLLSATRTADVRAILDERGQTMTSVAFAAWLAARRDAGASELAMLIGGPDGHGEAAVTGALIRLSLGPMTLPHVLARIVLAEQVYRAMTILSGHPYHRA